MGCEGGAEGPRTRTARKTGWAPHTGPSSLALRGAKSSARRPPARSPIACSSIATSPAHLAGVTALTRRTPVARYLLFSNW